MKYVVEARGPRVSRYWSEKKMRFVWTKKIATRYTYEVLAKLRIEMLLGTSEAQGYNLVVREET